MREWDVGHTGLGRELWVRWGGWMRKAQLNCSVTAALHFIRRLPASKEKEQTKNKAQHILHLNIQLHCFALAVLSFTPAPVYKATNRE